MSAKPPPPAKPAKAKPPPAKPSAIPRARPKAGFLAGEMVLADQLPDEAGEMRRHRRQLRTLFAQTVAMAALAVFLVFTMPVYQPIYQYAALNPAGHASPLVALDMPNLTDRAVLSWATSGVTQILTIGFGDFNKKLLAQKPRFTSDGWDSFVAAFFNEKIGQSFRHNQLVLTTVPSDASVVIAEGVNKDGIYQWKVQVPVVMTYATNNNVTRRDHAIITLTIVRVWPEQNPAGIAVKNWS
ncbi:MAG TPA: DotI/IcmL/TraM family protein [Alphaproteobacteria bacterium]|nr:DotI/IcmL/TraM family protein [Alphaproteobacteria bacterium]